METTILTACITIFGSVFVYIIGQLLSKFLIDPTHELKKVIGEVRLNLAFYAQTVHTPISRTPEHSDKAHDAFLKSSCELLAKVNTIPFYWFVARISFGFLPSKKNIMDAARQLRGLSTYMHETGDKASYHVEEIRIRVTNIENCLNLMSIE